MDGKPCQIPPSFQDPINPAKCHTTERSYRPSEKKPLKSGQMIILPRKATAKNDVSTMRTGKTAHISKQEPTFGNRQNRTRTFIRKMNEKIKNAAQKTKSVAKTAWKPVAVTATAAALYFTLSTGKAVAQDYTTVSDSKNKVENTIEEPKIFGTKTFAVKYERGTLYLDSVKIDEKRFATFQVTVENADKMGIADKSMQNVNSIYYTNLDGVITAYLIFDHGIMVVAPQARETNGGAHYAFVGSENSLIFQDAIFIAQNGAILATTPTTLLEIMPTFTLSIEYKQIGGENTPDLTKPNFKEGATPYLVDLRDPTFNDGKSVVKLQINTTKFEVIVLEDNKPIGGGD